VTRPFGNFFNVEWHVVGLTKKKGKRSGKLGGALS